MKARRTDRRMAIPFEEIEANMVTNGTASTRYSRKDVFISEQEASARAALGMMIMGAISLIFICFAIWACFYAIGKAEAHSGHIYAKSEMTKAEVKALNIVQAKGERHAR